MLVAAGLLASLATALPASSIHRAEPVLETRQNRNTQVRGHPSSTPRFLLGKHPLFTFLHLTNSQAS